MRFFRDKKFRDAALDRAIRTVCQNLVSMIPTGMIVTPVMITKADWNVALVILAWILTALLSGLVSILTSIAKGMPEYTHEELAEMGIEDDNTNNDGSDE